MLIVNLTAESNGAHASQMSGADIAPPDGWAVIPSGLEATALPLLPWVTLTVTDGEVTAVAEDTAGKAAWMEPEQPVDQITQLQLALAELAELMTEGSAG